MSGQQGCRVSKSSLSPAAGIGASAELGPIKLGGACRYIIESGVERAPQEDPIRGSENILPLPEGVLASDGRSQAHEPGLSTGYRFYRWLVRLWLALSFRRIRLLHGENLEPEGPFILAVSHPASFLDAVILVAAFDRPVHCLVEGEFLRGLWRGLLARGLGMIPYEREGEGWRGVVETCRALLARHAAVVAFAGQDPGRPGEVAALAAAPASLAVEAESRSSGQLGIRVLPVDLFLPVARSQSSELLIYVDSPIKALDYCPPTGGDVQSWSQALAEVIERRFRENAFRLQPGDLTYFLSDLEDVLRADLGDDWASRPNWKQSTEGFQLSRLVVEWAEQLNFLNPGRLVALREMLDSYRKAQRRCSLRRFRVEAADNWINSPTRRAGVWFESVAGWGVALYGLINHALPLALLSWAGLLKKESGRDGTITWLTRALVVLGFYAGQILLVAHLLGRSKAGYYAPTLPLSGAYLWRYVWLLRHRTKPAFLELLLPAQAAKVRRRRKEFLEELNRVLSRHAESAGFSR